ncbi:MAG: YiiX/YebB-like N1pC/P60 family cysteine hydrolase [Pseudomonadota bacterium]
MDTTPPAGRPPIDHPRVVRAGRVIDGVGQAMLPTGLGALAGFYAADQGMRLLPDLLELTLAWTLGALAFIALGKLLRGRLFKPAPEGVRLRKRVVAVLVLMALALGARLGVHYLKEPSPLTELSPAAFEEAFVLDAATLREDERGLERLLQTLERAGVPAPGNDVVLSADDEVLLLQTWQALLDYLVSLDATRVFWEDWYRFDPSRVERSQHLRAFLLCAAAEATLYEKAARFTAPVLKNPSAKKFLDEAHPAVGLPEGSFSHLREEVLGARDQAMILAGERYLEILEKGLGGRREARELGVEDLWRELERRHAVIEAVAPIDRAALTVRADAQPLKRSVRRVWFPVQKETADWMGDVRVRRVGWYLIPEEQQEEAAAKMQPGDIMLTRKNWYLSNVGLPGFWPHALLYLGAPDELTAYFDDPVVLEWLEVYTGQRVSLPDLLEQQFPEAWLRYRIDDEGHPHRIIEAVSEGVVFNTMNHASGDYMAAVRPQLDKVAKAQAILEAFSYWGRPYDFDFDFATDHAVVCTELVWRSYRPAEGKEGLEFPLTRVAGRVTLPANVLAQHFAERLASPEPGYDFVVFIDAHEKERTTFFSDQASFAASWQRTKWDIAQQ